MTAGKASFDDLYNAPDAAPYVAEMQRIGYEIADHAAAIARRAIRTLAPPAGEEPLHVLELCAGYGVSMAPVRTEHLCAGIPRSRRVHQVALTVRRVIRSER